MLRSTAEPSRACGMAAGHSQLIPRHSTFINTLHTIATHYYHNTARHSARSHAPHSSQHHHHRRFSALFPGAHTAPVK
jgi:hypothetical protein